MSDTDTIINKALMERILEKKKILDSKSPLPKDALQRLKEWFRLQHTYHSNAMEGNTLTLAETKLVIEEGITAGKKPLKDCLEAANTAKAFNLIEEMAKGKKQINHVTVQQIHEALTKGILAAPGRYRTQNVKVTGAKKSPPDFSKIPKLMDDLIVNIRKSRRNPVETAAFLHHRFVEIHPFIDGNGRTARLLSNLYLIRNGYSPVVLKKEDRGKYYATLRNADDGNLSPFANFIAKAVNTSLTHYLSIFGENNELLPLKELTKTSPYSQEYLSLRSRQGRFDAVKVGRIWYSTKRALKQYMKNHHHE